MAGMENKKTVFLFNDTQIKKESFLEDVDSLLNSGEVPNIFAPDEKSEICEAVRSSAQESDPNAEFSPMQLYSFFISRCKDNLHLILGMSPIGGAFRNRLRMFPSLVNCCTIDWFRVCTFLGAFVEFRNDDFLLDMAHRRPAARSDEIPRGYRARGQGTSSCRRNVPTLSRKHNRVI